MPKRLRVFTWHVHSAYLSYLAHCDCDFFIPDHPSKRPGYIGLPGENYDWGRSMHAVDAADIPNRQFDLILFQSQQNYRIDQYSDLSPAQRLLPKIYLEHDPPRESPTETAHSVDDPSVLLVHVTHFNDLMWNAHRTPTKVILHGIPLPKAPPYSGTIRKGIVVVNSIGTRGRRLGLDIVREFRERTPLDIIGMDSSSVGGLGEISHRDLPAFLTRYRYFFHPARYTSLGLAVCEAMALGMPVVGFATTELPAVVTNGKTGFLSTSKEALLHAMELLRMDHALAARIGKNAQRLARKAFSISRFARQWDEAFRQAISLNRTQISARMSRLTQQRSITV